MRAALLFVCAAAGLAQAGCPPCDEPPAVSLATFESCADDTCGFAVSAGAQVWIEATVHPGEHALFLVGETQAVGAVDAAVALDAGAWPELELVTSCSGELGLAVDELAGDRYRLTVTLPAGPTPGPLDSYTRLSAQLPNQPDDDGVLELAELRVVNTAGGCAVDDIAIVGPEVCR